MASRMPQGGSNFSLKHLPNGWVGTGPSWGILTTLLQVGKVQPYVYNQVE